MLATGELQPAAGYDDGRWLLLCLLAAAGTAAYFVVVWWLTRARRPRPPRPAVPPRDDCLAELVRIEGEAAAGQISAREAHQELSRAVRTFVATASDLPADTMTLAALRAAGPSPLADLVAGLYRPEFGPDEDDARRELDRSITHARTVVESWG